MLAPVTRLLLEGQPIDRWQQNSGILRFRVGGFIGARYRGLTRSSAGVALHLVAVLTEDGHQYWVVYLHHMLDQGSLNLATVVRDDQLLQEILSSAVIERSAGVSRSGGDAVNGYTRRVSKDRSGSNSSPTRYFVRDAYRMNERTAARRQIF